VGLKLYNTRTRTKDAFVPLDPSHIRMYVCGPTVYDHAHIGNARPIIVFDVLYRLVKHLAAKGEWDGGKGETKVTYARNITDVDDKINARAADLYPDMTPEAAIRKLTTETTAQFHADVAALGCLPPDVEPRATDYIEQMKDMITRLYEAEIAYVAEDHVLFSIAAYGKLPDAPAYGALARRSLDEMIAGARVEVAPYKREAMDFVLWKPSKAGEPGWPSPLGIATPGRPGWHLECSAMSKAILGDEFDIHGGGIDLVFPHHENEVAQSCGANRTAKMANFWMHNGFLQVEGQKMSKSLGNFLTINQLLKRVPGEVLRLAMLKSQYREPINWTHARLQESWEELENWILAFDQGDDATNYEFFFDDENRPPNTEIIEELFNDLNSHDAITKIRFFYKAAIQGDETAIRDVRSTLIWLGLYRPTYHHAYMPPSGCVAPVYFTKYKSEISMARAIILNEYQLNPSARKLSHEIVEAKINQIDPRMAVDGVYLKLHEQGRIELVPLNDTARQNKEFIAGLIEARNAARKAKNWVEADRIRDELAAMSIALKDTKDPETGEITTIPEIAR
jgi:cysteinyl-tRNA synthetase